MDTSITMDDVEKAMEQEIVIASAVNGPKKRLKDYKYRIDTQEHTVRTKSADMESSTVFFNPAEAIRHYNAFTL